MIIWDLQDKGYKKYRIKINGDTCETCKELDEKVFSISEAKSGENFPLIHPNCDCTVEILDNEKNVVHTIKNELKENKSLNIFEYLQDSLEQVILGNWTSEVNLFGTLLQVISGFIGIDIIADVRDILYDLIKFNSSHQHILQTIFDIISVIPIVGGVKYIDEASDVLNITSKYGDEAADVIKTTKREILLKKVENEKLKNAINEIYRANAKIGDGGLGDAIRYEKETGILVGGKSHILKGKERLKNLENILEKQNLNESDIKITESLIEDLKSALKEN